jgi:hypothetical protein
MKTVEECNADIAYCHIRNDVIESINRYVMDGLPLGGFLQAVIANDLTQTMGRADRQNRNTIFEITAYLYNEVPMGCRGSYDKYHEWVKSGGLKGMGMAVNTDAQD